MSLQSITNINVDFYDKKYILINAKQYDKNSRFLSITCYNHGEIYSINAGEHSAYIRYKKSDNNSVFNSCEIDRKGEIIVELTEQMLASDGICHADLVIVNKGSADIDVETGEIVAIENGSILSTMPLYIDVTETATENSNIESSYEFNGLNEALQKAEAEYQEVILTAKSWTAGGTGIRSGEDTHNARYYYLGSLQNQTKAQKSEQNAEASEQNAKISEDNAKTSEINSLASEQNAKTSETNAKISEDSAKLSESNAFKSRTNAQISETNANISEHNAKASETNAFTSEQNAKTSETNALNSANRAQSYAVGGTGTRTNEDNDNAYYYYNMIKDVVIGLNGSLIPMGTISFAELTTVEKATGYMYNIKDDFITDNSFREGEGKSYTAGVNVYYTANGQWDCLGGAISPAATVSEIKDYLGINDETEII